MVGEGQFDLLFVSQYWSDVHIVPLSGQCLLCMTGRPIKWNSLFTGIHTKAERDWLVSSQLKIEFCNIIVNELLHLLYYPYWDSKCKIEATWQLEACAGSNIVLTTYRCTCSDIHSLSTTVDQMYTRELTFAVKQVTCKLIPVCTCSMLIE